MTEQISDTARERNLASVRLFLELLGKSDIDSWITLWDEDAMQFYPFGTEMFPAVVRGRQKVYARWSTLPRAFRSMQFVQSAAWADGNTVLTRFDGDCVTPDGTHYRNSYLGIFVFTAGGLIKEYWEYFDPIVAATAFGFADVTYRAA